MFTSKGGVGKTSLAAATGIKLAGLNYRTLVMSIDPAHSLGDSFDLETDLFHFQTSDPALDPGAQYSEGDQTSLAGNLVLRDLRTAHDWNQRRGG